eukprot:TRINITY_DN7944_c0_g1_i4.p1 TRINITY_DN7944_c0_g1~~TRINITY_DN7944_c0_g1_i4.p1  ORF type:complete len:1564 (+),score=583.71 TRINITY_DN7944_c0_g1_i4:124-4815(+)
MSGSIEPLDKSEAGSAVVEEGPWHGVQSEEEGELLKHGKQLTGLRRAAFDLVTWNKFDDIILGVIAINCISMAAYDPKDSDNQNTRNQVIEMIEWVLLGIFTLELLTKWVAFGIRGYFSVNWNVLDGLVVLVAWMSFVPGVGNYSVLRLLKALRPLRTMGKSGGMQRIISVIFAAMQQLLDVFLLCCLCFFIFGIVGVQLFQGKLTQHCFDSTTLALYVPAGDEQFRNCGGRYSCPAGYFCGTGQSSDYSAEGLGSAGNPNFGVTSFDDIGHAFLSIFVAITLEGWVDLMYNIQDAYSDPVSSIFFLLLILLGALFVLNLALAVVADEYDAQEAEGEQDEQDEQDEEINEVTFCPAEEASCATRMAMSGWFNNLIFVFIILNTATLSMEHVRTRSVCLGDSTYTGGSGGADGSCIQQAVEMDQSFKAGLEAINYVFVGIFTIEMAVKLIGLGPRLYVQDRFNVFDALIVLVSYVEIGFTSSSALTALRTFRLGRVFKMAKRWDSLRRVIETIIDTLPNMGYLSILLLLFMFIASVAGMQMLGGKMASLRSNYDNFGLGMLTTFQILTGENWNEVLYDGINSTSYFVMIYFLIVVVLGNFLILNLFLAILLAKFSTGDPPDMSIDGMINTLRSCLPVTRVTPEEDQNLTAADEEDELAKKLSQLRTPDKSEEIVRLNIAQLYTEERERRVDQEAALSAAGICEPSDPANPLELQGNSLFLFSETNPIRVGLARIVDTWLFEAIIFWAIVVSSLSLAMDQPGLDPASGVGQFLFYCNWTFTMLFSAELCIKVIVSGFIFTPCAYMKDTWNVLDLCIVVISNVALFSGSSGGSFKSLRALRALRPLRTIRRAPGLRVVVDALLACMPSFLNIGVVSLLFYLVFAIMGVQFWAGKFWTCNDSTVSGVSQCIGTYTDSTGATVTREWSNAPMNFDNVPNGLLSLFEVASLELWLDVMYSAMDVPSELGEQPERNSSWWFALYFVAFIIIGSFLVMNLFVGAVVDNFSQAKASTGRSMVLTQEQEDFTEGLRMMLQQKPQPKPKIPRGQGTWIKIRQSCYKICMWDRNSVYHTGQSFELVVSSLIVLNLVVMAMYVWQAPSSVVDINSDAAEDAQKSTYNDVLEVLNYVFTWIFFTEMCVKMVALGQAQYWYDHWNKLDGVVAVLSMLSFGIELSIGTNTQINPVVLRVSRASRIIRIFRLLKSESGKGVLRLLETLLLSLPALANVSALLLLLIFIFACLGMSFFGDLETGPGQGPDFANYPFKLYNEHANFTNFYRSFLLLFRMSTGESWNGIMHDCMSVHGAAWVYFCLYMVLVSYLLFNLLIAIVLEEFSVTMRQEQLYVSATDIALFAEAWRRYDTNGTHFIPATEVPVLLRALEPPLGVGAGSLHVMAFQEALYIPSENGNVHYVEVFTALLKHAYGTADINKMDRRCLTDLALEIGDEFGTLYNVKDSGDFLSTQAACKLQAVLKGNNVRHQKASSTGYFKGQPAPTSPHTMDHEHAEQSMHSQENELGLKEDQEPDTATGAAPEEWIEEDIEPEPEEQIAEELDTAGAGSEEQLQAAPVEA